MQVYAFGIMLNELFTGGIAFKGGWEAWSLLQDTPWRSLSAVAPPYCPRLPRPLPLPCSALSHRAPPPSSPPTHCTLPSATPSLLSSAVTGTRPADLARLESEEGLRPEFPLVTLTYSSPSLSPATGTKVADLARLVSEEGLRPDFPLVTPSAYRSLAQKCWGQEPESRWGGRGEGGERVRGSVGARSRRESGGLRLGRERQGRGASGGKLHTPKTGSRVHLQH